MTEEMFVPFCSTEIAFLNPAGLQDKLYARLASKNVVLVLSRSGEKRWNLSSFVEGLQEKAAALTRISDVPSNPTPDDIASALKSIGSAPVDGILAIGGGSCIDLAKGISAFYSSDGILSGDTVLEMVRGKSYASCKGIDIVAVPTTAGTGSEVTQWATVWDMKNKEKYSIDCPQLKPKAAYIVPEFTLSLSKELTLSTGLDALSHAVEAYWSKFTTPLVQDIALRSVELLVSNLKEVLEQPNDIVLRERICRASLLAGLAFSQTRTTACHAISYPLTMLYGISHGFAAALTLAGVASLNKGHFPNDDALFQIFSDELQIKNIQIDNRGEISGWLEYVSKDVIQLHLNDLKADSVKKTRVKVRLVDDMWSRTGENHRNIMYDNTPRMSSSCSVYQQQTKHYMRVVPNPKAILGKRGRRRIAYAKFLSAFSESDLRKVLAKSVGTGRMENNPVTLTECDVWNILMN